MTRIDSNTLNRWRNKWVPINTRKPPNGGWNWEFKVTHFQKNYHKYIFDMAIFSENGELSGLVLGKESRRQTNLSIYYIEGSPNQSSPLKGYIFSIVNIAVSEYAKFIGIKKLRLIEPYDFELKKKTLFGKPYCEKEIL